MHLKAIPIALYAFLLSTSLTAGLLFSAPAAAKYDKRFKDFGNLTASQILGVPENSGYEAYKSAYRQLVVKYHTDKNIGDSSNEQRLRAINVAWDYIKGIEIAERQDELESDEDEKEAETSPAQASKDPSDELLRAAEAYARGKRARDAELMKVLNENFRIGEVQPIIALLERRYKADFDSLLFVLTQNLYLGPATELLLKASVQYFITKYPQYGDSMVEIYYNQLTARLEILAPSFLSSPEAREQVHQLTRLLDALERTRVAFGRKPRKSRAGRPECEHIVSNRKRN